MLIFEILFTVLHPGIFHNPSFSPRSATTIALRKYFYWNLSFCGPHNDGIPKIVVSFDKPLCCYSIFPKIHGSIHSSRSQSKTIYLYQNILLKFDWFSFFPYNSKRPVLRKKTLFIFENLGFRNFHLSKTTHLNKLIPSSINWKLPTSVKPIDR